MLQKRVLTKEKIERQLSGQSSTTTPFMKVGDIQHSSKTVSFNAHNLIKEQLESLTSKVYNMSIHKEDNIKPFKPQISQRKRRGQYRQNFGNRNRNTSFSRDRQRQNFRPNYRRQSQDRCTQCGHGSRRGRYRHQNYDNRNDSRDRGRQDFRRNLNNDRYDNRDRSRTRQRCLTPRRNDKRRYDSPNVNLGTRNRSNSRVATNRDRIRCYRCREYDHFANECPNMDTDGSNGYASDRPALQLMTTEAEIHDNFDTTRLNEETDYLNL